IPCSVLRAAIRVSGLRSRAALAPVSAEIGAKAFPRLLTVGSTRRRRSALRLRKAPHPGLPGWGALTADQDATRRRVLQVVGRPLDDLGVVVQDPEGHVAAAAILARAQQPPDLASHVVVVDGEPLRPRDLSADGAPPALRLQHRTVLCRG